MKSEKIILGTLALLIASIIALFVLVLTKAEKVAYIDTGVLMEKSRGIQAIKKQLEQEQGSMKANVDTLTSEFQNALKDYEKNRAKMSGKEKQLSEELLQTRQQQLMQYQQAVQQKAQGEEQKKTQEVLVTINAKIKEYGEKNGYKLIFATSGGNIAYGDKGVDITEEIVKLINE